MAELRTRKHLRLKSFDYSSNGVYFLTVCTIERHELFGLVGGDALGAPCIRLTEYGTIVHDEITETPSHYEGIVIDKFVVMPNHIHMLISIDRDISGAPRGSGVPGASRPTMLIPVIISALKKKTTKKIGFSIWQTSYHDHIIRNDDEYLEKWNYIDQNPSNWLEDIYHS